MQSVETGTNGIISTKHTQLTVLSVILATIYYLLLQEILSGIDFSLFYYRSAEFTTAFNRLILASSIGMFATILLFLSRVERTGETLQLVAKIIAIALSWFFSFAVFYSYAPELILESTTITQLPSSVQYLLSLFVTPLTGILFAILLFAYWNHQIYLAGNENDRDVTLPVLLYSVLLFPLAAILGYILMIFTGIIMPSFGEGSAFSAVIISGLLSCYVITRSGFLRLIDTTPDEQVPPLIIDSTTWYMRILDGVLDVIILLLVLVPAFALSGLYVSDAPEFYNPYNFEFQSAFIRLTLLLPIPLALYFASRFQK